ncbi:unnamed protein product [Fraxinus pennsylvanica]|uniref:Uncharacterized protein n=1 Tax=Fraxinus pennsylvanica TaxID=56036 RepID=A0AAD1ZVA9_9LAMI|nr:unnamed protein product [Fraxinus pennsylvanica]
MYFVNFSSDDKVVTRAIELNEQLERILQRHDALISSRTTLVSTQKLTMNRQGKRKRLNNFSDKKRKSMSTSRGRRQPKRFAIEIEETFCSWGNGSSPPYMASTVEQPMREPVQQPTMEPMQETAQPPTVEQKQEANVRRPLVALPPAPAKPVERERFFRDGSALNGQ